MKLPRRIAQRRMQYEAARVPQWEGMLSAEELERYAAFPVEKRRREFLLGRAVLRTLAAEQTETPPTEVPLRVAEDGAVEWVDAPHHVSLAHADTRAVAVMAPFRVGVDLEQIAAYEPEVRQFALRPDELEQLGAGPLDRDAAFICIWTLKEAVLKARRTGLRTAPKRVHLDIGPDIDPEALRGTAQVQGEAWHVAAERWDDFFLSVAWEQDAPR